MLEEVKRKKLFELESNIMMRKKLMSKELTQTELENIEKEEFELVHSKASQQIKQKLDQLDKIKLKQKEEILLKKLIDFGSLQQYDSEEIRSALYKLFFEWQNFKKGDKAAE